MNWYYYDGKNRVGPLNDEQFAESIRTGKLLDSMLVWKPGMHGWQRLAKARSMPELKVLTGVQKIGDSSQQQVSCMNCGHFFLINDVIPYEKGFICPKCKPEFIQRLKEGAPLPGVHIDPEVFSKEILNHDYNLSISDCIGKGWELLKHNFWNSVGAVVVIYLILFVSQMIPFVSYIASLVLTGPLMGGLYYFFIRLARNDSVGIGDAFAGFSGVHFVQLMLAYIIQMVCLFLCMLPLILFIIFYIGLSAFRSGNILQHPSFATFLPIIFIAILTIPVFTYFSVAWLYAFPLVIDKKLSFWNATIISIKMVNKHWFRVFGLLFLGGLVSMLGLIGCCIGIVVTVPIFFSAIAYSYIEIFKG